jgi:hypothetical protein
MDNLKNGVKRIVRFAAREFANEVDRIERKNAAHSGSPAVGVAGSTNVNSTG